MHTDSPDERKINVMTEDIEEYMNSIQIRKEQTSIKKTDKPGMKQPIITPPENIEQADSILKTSEKTGKRDNFKIKGVGFM